MPQSLEMIAALANFEHGNEQNTILETLSKNVEDFHIYKFIPEEGQYYASVNWRGILGDIANIAGIASFIWLVYEKTIEPELNKSNDKPVPAVIIQIKDSNNNIEMFRISNNYESKEIFIKEFTEKVERLRHLNNSGDTILERYESSERWLKINK